MSTQNIVNERSRRTSIAALLLEREDFDPTYEDDNAVDPQNLPDNILAIYNTLVDSNLQVVDPNASIFGDAEENVPNVAGTSGRDPLLASLLSKLVEVQERRSSFDDKISQKEATYLIQAVPPLVKDGTPLSGAKLLAWFEQLTGTYLTGKFWTSSYAFNSLSKLFEDAPDLKATWERVTQSDEKVVAARNDGEFEKAWSLVAEAMIVAHTGDRHAAHRRVLGVRPGLAQNKDKTVAATATGLLEDAQSKLKLGLWDGIATLLADLEQDAASAPLHSLFGLNLQSDEDRATHAHIVNVLRQYVDKQRALELYGALRSDAKTYLEDEMGDELLNHTATLAEVRSKAVMFETRERNRANDLTRQLKLLGLDPSSGGGKGKKATTNQVTGGGGKGGGGKGRNSRGTQRQRGKRGGKGKGNDRPPSDLPPIAGLDGKILEWILCYGCNRYGHVKKKDGIVNCPTWKEPNAPPKAVVEQVVGQGGAAPDIDIDALLKAAAMLDDGDENAAAVMKQMYLKYAEENKASKASVKMIRGRDALVLNVNAQGRERASGESFLAYVGNGRDPLRIEDDGGSPVSLVSPAIARSLPNVRYLPTKSLLEQFASVESASGHDLGYTGDVEIDLYPVDKNGERTNEKFPVVLHVVANYSGESILLGTQQHAEWGMDTAHKTMTKTITSARGVEVEFPFSVTERGVQLKPSAKAEAVLPTNHDNDDDVFAPGWLERHVERCIAQGHGVTAIGELAAQVAQTRGLHDPLYELGTPSPSVPIAGADGQLRVLADQTDELVQAGLCKWVDGAPSKGETPPKKEAEPPDGSTTGTTRQQVGVWGGRVGASTQNVQWPLWPTKKLME